MASTSTSAKPTSRFSSCKVFKFAGSSSKAPPPPPTVQCNDTFDNDGDGFIDQLDPQCTGPTDTSESS